MILSKIPREDEEAIDQVDIRRILNQCHNLRLKTYLMVLSSSGVRPIEACALRVYDIDFDKHPTGLRIQAKYTKTKRSRDIFISDEASRQLKEWMQHRFGNDFFKTKNTDRQITQSLVFQVYDIGICSATPQSIYKKLNEQFHNVLAAIGFDERKDGLQQRRKITLHTLEDS